MNTTTLAIVETLKAIQGDGSFACHGSFKFVFPKISISGAPELSYPIQADLAQELIALAEPAPFGHGHETLVDASVRNAWEIDASKISFEGSDWNNLVAKSLKEIRSSLGMECYGIRAELYKMLIYEPGGFFLPHRDSEKTKGMFGTLVFALPSKHAGGELVVQFNGSEQCFSFDQDCSSGRIPYAAFYADCEHEIKALESGYRVVLVYNLIQVSSNNPLSAYSLDNDIQAIADLLKNEDESIESLLPRTVLLGHQYSPENFSFDALKLEDRAKANVLMRAAEQAGFYASLCLVTSYKSGAPAYDEDSRGNGYYNYDDDEDSDDIVEMGEIYDEGVSIARWVNHRNLPMLEDLCSEEDDLIPLFDLKNDEPLIKESTGYMGNYGPDVNFWYHYGAVVLWPMKSNKSLLNNQPMHILLDWLDYYATNYSQLSTDEKSCAVFVLEQLNLVNMSRNVEDCSAVSKWFVVSKDLEGFEKYGVPFVSRYFDVMDSSAILMLFSVYGFDVLQKIKVELEKDISIKKTEALLAILFESAAQWPNETSMHVTQLPSLFQDFHTQVGKDAPLLSASSLDYFLKLLKLFPQQKAWHQSIGAFIFSCKDREFENDVLAQTLLKSTVSSDFFDYLKSYTLAQIQARVDNKPMPPEDFKRSMPENQRYVKDLSPILHFLQSPEQEVFDYRAVQNLRNALEYAIDKSGVDLRCETIRKGSPHTLRLIKTTRGYDKALSKWLDDSLLLKRLKKV